MWMFITWSLYYTAKNALHQFNRVKNRKEEEKHWTRACEWLVSFVPECCVVHFDSPSLPVVRCCWNMHMEMICAIKLNESIVDYVNKKCEAQQRKKLWTVFIPFVEVWDWFACAHLKTTEVKKILKIKHSIRYSLWKHLLNSYNTWIITI